MVVWKQHGIDPPDEHVEHMMKCLEGVGDARFGPGNHRADPIMRQVPDHFHAHTRDGDWLTRRWTDRLSLYTGVGGERAVR